MEMERDAIQSQHSVTSPGQQPFASADLQQLREALNQDRRSLEVERRSLQAQFDSVVQQERDQLDRERSSLRQLMEEEVSRELHAQMEVRFHSVLL